MATIDDIELEVDKARVLVKALHQASEDHLEAIEGVVHETTGRGMWGTDGLVVESGQYDALNASHLLMIALQESAVRLLEQIGEAVAGLTAPAAERPARLSLVPPGGAP